MRVILGLDSPDAGQALISGRPYSSLRRRLTQAGALLDAAALQPSRTARNDLLWLARDDRLVRRRGSGGRLRHPLRSMLSNRLRAGTAGALLLGGLLLRLRDA